MKTPRELGYRIPAEWEEHEGTWLQWPHSDTFEASQLRLEHLWLMMTAALHQHETVHIAVTDERRRDNLQQQIIYNCFDEKQIDIHVIPTNDVWARDSGPIFITNEAGDIAATDWNFNGWGSRYVYDKDRLVPSHIAEALELLIFKAPITLEGGGIEVNGRGILIATRTSIINPNRNPGISQGDIEKAIKDFFGVSKIIWISGATREYCDSVGGDTDFHVDGFARFVNETTLLYTATEDRSHPSYQVLKQNHDDLCKAMAESGSAIEMIPLPVPKNVMYTTLTEITRPPFKTRPSLAIYANFYIANGVVLVPVYGDIHDANAKSIIAEHFPDREIIALPSLPTAELGGMMHCVTQQQPAVLKSG